MFTKKSLLTLILCSVCFQALAIDLTKSISKAFFYNADYLAQVDADFANGEAVSQSRALFLPQVATFATISENQLSTSGTSITYHQPSVGIIATQNLINLNLFSNYTKALFERELSSEQLHLNQDNLKLKVIQAYFKILSVTDSLNTIKSAKIFYKNEYEKAQISYKNGMISVLDVSEAKSYLDEALANEVKTLNDLNKAKNIFYNLTGENPDLVQPITPVINPNILKIDTLDNLESMVLQNNRNVILSKTQLKMAEADISIAKSNHMPNLSLYGAFVYLGSPVVDNADSGAMSTLINQGAGLPGSFLSNYTIAAVGVQLSIPIFSGGAITSQTRQAMSNYEVALFNLKAIERTALANLKTTYWEALNNKNLIDANWNALKSAQLKLKSDQTAYKLGLRNSIKLMNGEKILIENEENYNQVRYNYLIAVSQLKFLTNQLNEEFIELLNQNVIH